MNITRHDNTKEVFCPSVTIKCCLNKNNPALDINALALDISGKKQVGRSEIFMCENCNNIQSFMKLSDK